MSKGNARWLAAGVATLLAVLAGCASPVDYGGVEGPGLPSDPTASDPCAVPSEGCPCSDPGQAMTCGDLVQKEGDYVTCSQGARTCGSDGQWGACVGAFTYRLQTLAGGAEIHRYKLNAPVACLNNPCDPTCETFMDDGSGLDAGVDSGLSITDAGVSLYGNPVPQSVCSSLSVAPNPGSIVITSMAPSPNTASFAASIGPTKCYAGTPTYLWSINQYDVAQISTSGLVTVAVPYAVPITVTAYAGTLSASTVCNVTVNVVDTSAAPAGYSNTQFPVTTGVADSIAIVYPYPGTVFPLGLSPPLIQWQNNNSPATTASAVKVTLRFPSTGTPTFSWAEIVPELQTQPTPTLPGQPRASISASVWQAFQQTVVRNSGASGGDAVFAVQRYVSGALAGRSTRPSTSRTASSRGTSSTTRTGRTSSRTSATPSGAPRSARPRWRSPSTAPCRTSSSATTIPRSPAPAAASVTTPPPTGRPSSRTRTSPMETAARAASPRR